MVEVRNPGPRPSAEENFLEHAAVAAKRSTCARRAVGCVLVNARHQIDGVGRNGVPAKFPHCNAGTPCLAADSPTGTHLDACLAVHAEVNAFARCSDIWSIDTAYITTTPCVSCVKLMLSSSCRRIVAASVYPAHIRAVVDLWVNRGRRDLILFDRYWLLRCGPFGIEVCSWPSGHLLTYPSGVEKMLDNLATGEKR